MKRVQDLSESGVSLVEPLVAMVVLSISLVGSISMFAVAQEGVSESARSLQAMALTESRMELLRALPYHSLLSGDLNGDGSPGAPLQDGGGDGDEVAGDGEYTARQTVDGIAVTWSVRPDQPNLANSRAAVIKVTAEWSGRGGQLRKVRLVMRRANPVFSGGSS